MTTTVVAIDTATDAIVVALARLEDCELTMLADVCEIAPRLANSRVLCSVSERLIESGLRPADVDVVVVGRGPGSFTGVRIGVAAAKGFAHGLGIALAGVSTLDAIAWRNSGTDGLVGVLVDAMRKEVYPALYRVSDGHVERLTPQCVMGPATVAEEWAEAIDEPVTLVGSGLRSYADVFAGALGSRAVIAAQELWWPSGEGLLRAFIALPDDERQGFAPGVVLPIYTRLSDAEEAERLREKPAVDGGLS